MAKATVVLFLVLIGSIATDRALASSSDNRASMEAYEAMKLPIIEFGPNNSAAIGAGFEVGRYLSRDTIAVFEGRAALGGTIGDGTMDDLTPFLHLNVGVKQFFGPFFIEPGIGLRYLQLRLYENRPVPPGESSDYDDETSYWADYGHVNTVSLGGSLSFGMQWQGKRITAGFDVTSMFLPFLPLATSAKVDPDHSHADAMARAANVARGRDFTLPHLILGISF